MPHLELHRTDRIGWLRAAVLGANDGIVSTASLMVGVAAANTAGQQILIAGVAGLVAGAMSMAAGQERFWFAGGHRKSRHRTRAKRTRYPAIRN